MTPNRKTRIYVDSEQSTELVDSGWSVRRVKGEIFSHRKNISSISLTRGGWKVKNKLETMFKHVDGDSSLIPRIVFFDNNYFSPSDFFKEKKKGSHIPSSELNYGPGGGILGQWLPVIKKSPKTEKILSDVIPPILIPKISPEPYNIPLDRVIESKEKFSEETSFGFFGSFYGTIKDGYGALLRFYFPGPASKNGNGIHCLEITGHEELALYEYIPSLSKFELKHLKKINNVVNVGLGGQIYVRFSIKKDYTSEAYPKTSVHATYIEREVFPISFIESLVELATTAMNTTLVNQNHVDTGVSWIGGKPDQDLLAPIAIDIRRDLFGEFQVFYSSYPTYPIVIVDSMFGIPGTGLNPSPIWLTWDYFTDDDSTAYVDMTMYDDLGNPLGSITEEKFVSGKYVQRKKVLIPKSGCRNYQVSVKFIADENFSPTLVSYIAQQGPYGYQTTIPEKEIVVPARTASFSSMGGTNDLSSETANIEFNDLANEFKQFDKRSSIKVRVEVEAGDKKCVLFRGYAQRTDSQVLGRFDQERFSGFPVKFWKNRRLSLSGPWIRLKQQFNKEVIQTLTGKNMYVVNLLEYLLNQAGFEADLPSVKELPVRFVPMDTESYSVINPGVNLYDAIMDIVKIYTGCYLIWDNNAGDNGKFKLLFPPRAPYTPKVKFTSKKTWDPDEENRLEMYLPSYADGDDAPYCPIVAGSLSHYVKPPEANKIVAGYLTRMAIDEWKKQVVVINPKSYDFFPPKPTADPEHPDYLGYELPMWINEPLLAGNKDVIPETSRFLRQEDDVCYAIPHWSIMLTYAKRIYDLAAHSVKMVTFEAPLVLIPHEDKPDTHVRPLRYYDPVTLNGIPYLVRSVNIAYTKDSHQKAIYELEMPRI